VILVSFELAMGELRGMINLCIPFNAIERVSSKLAANSWASYNKSGSTPLSRAQIGGQLERAEVDLVVTLAETQITTGDLIGLRVGDIITTDKDIRTPLDVAVQGVSKFLASPGALKGAKAIRIEAVPQALANVPPPASTAASATPKPAAKTGK
jgi:flagellar motor switch protein FliM